MLHTIPLFHANGWGAAHTITFMGGTHVMLPRFIPEEVFRLVERERVRALTLVPIMANALCTRRRVPKYDLSSVEWATIGGAASSPTLIREVEHDAGIQMLLGIWSDGMRALAGERRTETGHAVLR
jgi:fatty-acyl-CoA synthase